jgi:hypothetical protein
MDDGKEVLNGVFQVTLAVGSIRNINCVQHILIGLYTTATTAAATTTATTTIIAPITTTTTVSFSSSSYSSSFSCFVR